MTKVILSTDGDHNPYYDEDPEVADAFAAIEEHRAEPERIVRALAAMETPPFGRDHETYECSLCSLDADDVFGLEVVERHNPECLWRRAREWVDGD